MSNFEPKLIDGQICFPCENNCGKYIPHSNIRICLACRIEQEKT